MLLLTIATLATGLFAGAAVYVNLVEHPARLSCGTEVAIEEFIPSYHRASWMQASLAVAGAACGIISGWREQDGLLIAAALLIGAVVPFTLAVIAPTNKQLLAPSLDRQGPLAAALLRRWGALHAVRSVLSMIAFAMFVMRLAVAAAPVALILGAHSAAAQSGESTKRQAGETIAALRPYTGVYRLAGDHRLGIDSFIADNGDSTLLFCDYETGLVRPLFRISPTEFAMGPSFAVRSPVELVVQFEMDSQGNAQRLTMQPTKGTATIATKQPSREEEVVFRHGDTSLAGTFIAPATPGPHPAIVLLHGSGPLTRHSFGPWPRFFNSLGLAVVVFDKRGTGRSTGVRLDASTGAPATLSSRYYPDDLADDALAALRFLQGRPEIDRKQIGVWGSSEGGMLATQVAARSNEVAFAIDSSGFMGPLWETLLYQAGALARGRGAPDADVDETMAFTRMWMEVARTGKGYEEFLKRRQAIIASGKSPLLSYESANFTSLEQMQWVWTHILAFSPLPALSRVTAPVLGVWGEADPLTDAPKAASAMREALSKGGNSDVTVRIFPSAGHSLMDTSRRGMAPGVFDHLRKWLSARVRFP